MSEKDLQSRSKLDGSKDYNEPTEVTWSFAIATYNRADMLREAVRRAVTQTELPSEVVIIDGSDDWQQTRDLIQAMLVELAPQIPLVYEEALKRSAAAQRNQATRQSSADIMFLFDDDTMMYHDCAEKIMDVYRTDIQNSIAGVAAISRGMPSDDALDSDGQAIQAEKAPRSALVNWVRRLLGSSSDLGVPYDAEYPDRPIPAAVQALPVARRRSMAGFQMTARRDFVLQEPFCELLLDRGPEDSDISYRLSRHGALLTAIEAKVCHVGSPSGRFSKFSREALGALGPAVLHRIYGTTPELSKKRYIKVLRKRLLAEFAKDIYYRQFTLPRTRGIAFAIRYTPKAYRVDQNEVEQWYNALQQRVLAK